MSMKVITAAETLWKQRQGYQTWRSFLSYILHTQKETIIDMRPAAMEGRIMSSGDSDPRSLLIFIMVTGTSCSIDMERAMNMHMVLLATGERWFSSSKSSMALRENTVALFPAPEYIGCKTHYHHCCDGPVLFFGEYESHERLSCF